MNRGQLIIDSPYRFFTQKEVERVSRFFNGFTNPLMQSGTISEGLVGRSLYVDEKTIGIFESLNNLKDELGISFSVDKNSNENNVFGFFPDLEKMAENENGVFDTRTFNKKNFGKTYKVLIPKGVGEYAIADASIGVNNDHQFFIKSLTPNKTTFLAPDAASRLRGDGRINELIVSKWSDGIVRVGNSDYGELASRLYQYNYGVFKGTKLMDDGSLLDMTSRAGSQTQSPNKIVNLLTAFQVQDSFGIKRNSYRNSNSTIGYMSGYELSDMLNTNDINKNYTYKMTFGLDNSNDILDITALDENGNEIKKFRDTRAYSIITDDSNKSFFKKDRAMTKIGYANSRLSDALQDYDDIEGISDVKKYNRQIIKAFRKGNGQITREESYKIANQIVLDYRVKTLDRYGFGNHDDVIHNIGDDAGYVQSFLNYYDKLKSDSNDIPYVTNLYNNLMFNLDVGTIAGNIYEGRLLNNLSTIGKQSKNTIDTKQFISQAFLNPLFAENAQGQRKAQSLDRLPEFVLTNNGKEINIAETMRGFFSNIQEMNYKKTQFNYLQRNAMINKLGSAAGFTKDDMPNVSNSMVRVLYAESDLAFQDSSIYTNSYAMQIPSMFDNKKSFDVSYASINRNAYGNISDDKITDFFAELQRKKYDWKQLDGEYKDIAETMVKNLLGEENYNKYLLSQGQEIISDLNNIGKAFDGITQIEGNEINYIKASNEATGRFNNWLNKFFIKSDSNSIIGILNPEMVDNSILTSVSGSNYANFDNIKFTSQGIEFGLNRVFVQGHGSKVMNDHIKSTTQVLTNLLGAKFSDGSKMFFEGIINEKYTKAKRGFTGTQFARILTTAAYNAISADYQDANLTKAQKFIKFKETMTNNSNGINNIFDIFNIDMRYDEKTGSILFDDKNVQHAIDAFDFNNYESLDAMIFDSIRKHRKKIFNKDLVNDEGRILGAYAQDLVARSYQNLLNQMDDNSKQRFRLYEENFDLLKDYITGDQVGLSTLGKIKRGWFLLTNNAMMMETKKRKTEEGLKLGRLSALTLTELGMDHVVDYIKNQATSNKNIRMVADYISLAAVKGTEFARDADVLRELGNKNYYNYTFGDNIINMANDVNVFNNVNSNSNINTFLENSPLGKIMSQSYNAVDGRLDSPVKGLIKGFNSEYIGELQQFFDVKNKTLIERTIGGLSGTSILGDDIYFFENGYNELSQKIQDFNILKSQLLKDNKVINSKAYANAFIETYNEAVNLDYKTLKQWKKIAETNGKEFNLAEQLYSNYRTNLFNNLVDELGLIGHDNKLTSQGELLKKIFEFSEDDEVRNNKNFNVFKSMFSIIDEYNNSLDIEDGSSRKIAFKGLGDRQIHMKAMNNFSLNKNQANTLSYNIKNLFSSSNNKNKYQYITNVLSAFFKDTDSIQGENISNITELQQISQFGNISFIIDNLSVDENGNIVPNAELSRYEKIMKTAGEIENLRQQKNAFNFLDSNDWEQLKGTDVVSEEVLTKTNKKLIKAFEKFSGSLTDANQIENVNENMDFLKQLYRFTDLDLENLDADVFNKMIMKNIALRKTTGSDKTINLISKEINNKLIDFRNAVKSNGINSNAKKALNKYGAIKSLSDIEYSSNMSFENVQLSNIQKELLEKLFYKNSKTQQIAGFDFDNFNQIIRDYTNGINPSKISDNQLEDVYEVKNFINKIIGGTFKEKTLFGYKEFKQFVDKLNSGNMSYDEYMNITDSLIGARQSSESIQLFRGVSQFVVANREDLISNIDSNIEEKSTLLTNLMMTRHNKLAERLFSKGGPLYEISTILNKASSAFSPREASSMTTFIKAEMLELMKNRQINSEGKILETKAYKDFKEALSLLYGKELVSKEIEKFDEIYQQNGLGRTKIIDTIEEIKKKLDLFSHVVIGTKEDWANAGRLHLFQTEGGAFTNVYYGLLSRNPHQYKLSVPAARMVMLNDAAVNLSFIGKYLGSGNKVQSTQSNLMMLGKLTALGAKGDFDGDTFQILSLGKKSLSHNIIKNMDPVKFAKEFDKRSELFYLMTNLAGRDLSTELSGSNFSEPNKKLIKLVSELYFDGKKISGVEAYNAIESNFLSLSHEKARVIRMLEDENKDHGVIPEAIGYYVDKVTGKKVSKKSIASFLLTLEDKDRNRYLQGLYDEMNLKKMIDANKQLDDIDRRELINLLNNNGGDFVLNSIKRMRDDSEVPLFQTIYNYVNNFLAYTGIAKTGEVHDKLTNFREVVDILSSQEELNKLINNFGITDTVNFNSKAIRNATMGHEIGDLIETLAISSKKGNTSPDVILKAFVTGESIIRNNDIFNYAVKRVADYNISLGREANAGLSNTLSSIKKKTFSSFFKELYLDINNKLSTGKDSVKNSADFKELMKTFLTMSTNLKTEEIDDIVKNSSTTLMGEIFKDVDSRKFISVLSNWSEIMVPGNFERITNTKNLNRATYNRLFGDGAVRNFFRRTTELLDVIKIGDKGVGTRLNSLMFSLFGGNRFFKVINNSKKEKEKIIEVASDKMEEADAILTTEAESEVIKKSVNNVLEEKTVSDIESSIDSSTKSIHADEFKTPKMEQTTLNFQNSDSVENVIGQSNDINRVAQQHPDNNAVYNNINDSPNPHSSSAVNNIESTIDNTNINKAIEDPSEIIKEIEINKSTENLSREAQDEISKLKQQLKEAFNMIENYKKEIEKVRDDDFNIIKEKQNKIEELRKIIKSHKDKIDTMSNDKFVSDAAEVTAEANPTMTQKAVENISNSKLVKASKEAISKHKKMTVAAVGVGVLATFFRIFQSNRPVVNLDINEQEYERSQGSVYRNLGQYTMNTNIRSLY